MTSALDSLHRTRFEWPEPLVLELIVDIYGAHDDSERWEAAGTHARFLRGLVEDERQRTTEARLELIVCCAARGIAAEAIERAEQAVFGELTRIVQMRFRNSLRLRDAFLAQLRAAQETLPKRPEPPRKPAPSLRLRAPLRLRPSLAPAA